MSDSTSVDARVHGVELPFSEVCMSMRVAGQTFDVELLPHGMAQLYEPGTENKFSFPITQGEAGVSHVARAYAATVAAT